MRKIASTILSDLFLTSLFLYLAGMLADSFAPGIISRALNLSILLAVCVCAGIFSILIGPPEEKHKNKQSVLLWAYIMFLTSVTGIMIWQTLAPLSRFAVLFAIAGACIVFFALFAMMRDNDYSQ